MGCSGRRSPCGGRNVAARHLFPFRWSEDEVVVEERHGGWHPHEHLIEMDEGGQHENGAGRKVDEVKTKVARDGKKKHGEQRQEACQDVAVKMAA